MNRINIKYNFESEMSYGAYASPPPEIVRFQELGNDLLVDKRTKGGANGRFVTFPTTSL
ncbi:MAG: hypothetical protein ACO1QB_12830 [Verrucomicrobiales bacterium]